MIIPALARAEEDRHRGALEESHESFIAQIVTEFIEKLSPSPATFYLPTANPKRRARTSQRPRA